MTNFQLIEAHEKGTIFCSFPTHMRNISPTYEQIISKGKDIVPDILTYLRDNESGMATMLLLWDILKISPYEPEKLNGVNGEEVNGMVGFKVKDARQAWLNWGKKMKLI